MNDTPMRLLAYQPRDWPLERATLLITMPEPGMVRVFDNETKTWEGKAFPLTAATRVKGGWTRVDGEPEWTPPEGAKERR